MQLLVLLLIFKGMSILGLDSRFFGWRDVLRHPVEHGIEPRVALNSK